MRIEITSKSLNLTDVMRDHVDKRLRKLKRYFDGILDFHVIVRVERFVHRVEITLHGQGFDFFSEGHAEDLYAAFDSAAERMERQVRKLKEKIRGKRSRRAPLLSSPEVPDSEGIAEEI